MQWLNTVFKQLSKIILSKNCYYLLDAEVIKFKKSMKIVKIDDIFLGKM